jgi:hypothetical protein
MSSPGLDRRKSNFCVVQCSDNCDNEAEGDFKAGEGGKRKSTCSDENDDR